MVLIDFLRTKNPKLGSSEASWLVDMGCVYVDRRRILDPSLIVHAESLIRVHWEPKRYRVNASALDSRIIDEHADFLVVDKPSGLPMHPTVDNRKENLAEFLREKFKAPIFVTHRLDVPTSGLVLVARNAEFQARFNKLLMKGRVHKKYRALSVKSPELGLYRHWMKPDLRAPKIVSSQFQEGWDECRLRVLQSRDLEISWRSEQQYLDKLPPLRRSVFESEIDLETGRTHQIRAQLGLEGYSLLGDPDYGGEGWEHFGLMATELRFWSPWSKKNFEWRLTAKWGQ